MIDGDPEHRGWCWIEVAKQNTEKETTRLINLKSLQLDLDIWW